MNNSWKCLRLLFWVPENTQFTRAQAPISHRHGWIWIPLWPQPARRGGMRSSPGPFCVDTHWWSRTKLTRCGCCTAFFTDMPVWNVPAASVTLHALRTCHGLQRCPERCTETRRATSSNYGIRRQHATNVAAGRDTGRAGHPERLTRRAERRNRGDHQHQPDDLSARCLTAPRSAGRRGPPSRWRCWRRPIRRERADTSRYCSVGSSKVCMSNVTSVLSWRQRTRYTTIRLVAQKRDRMAADLPAVAARAVQRTGGQGPSCSQTRRTIGFAQGLVDRLTGTQKNVRLDGSQELCASGCAAEELDVWVACWGAATGWRGLRRLRSSSERRLGARAAQCTAPAERLS